MLRKFYAGVGHALIVAALFLLAFGIGLHNQGLIEFAIGDAVVGIGFVLLGRLP